MENKQELSKEVNVQTPQWANPTPAGLVALAVACACFFAHLNGLVDKSAMPLMGCWLLGGFVVQFVVGLLDLKSKSTAGGNTFLFFSAFFMLVGGLEMLIKYHAMSTGAPLDARIDGFAWAALTVAMFLWTPAFCKSFNLLSLSILALDVALPFIVLMDLKVISAAFAPVPAYALLVAGIIALYFGSALVVNTTFGKTVYPMFFGPKSDK
jgi:succinate-acetate transporter protein